MLLIISEIGLVSGLLKFLNRFKDFPLSMINDTVCDFDFSSDDLLHIVKMSDGDSHCAETSYV